MSIAFRITDAGWAAWQNAQASGTNAITIAEVAFGDAGHAIDDTATALANELARSGAAGGQNIGPQRIHITAVEDSQQDYSIREIGLILADGTLFGQWSDPIATAGDKVAAIPYVLTVDIAFDDLPDGAVVIANTEISFPPATETVAGRIEIATQAETDAGSDDSRAVTPAKLAGLAATLDHRGMVELASNAETQAGSDGARAVTPQALASLTASTSRRGVIEIATQTETDTGTDDARAVTPKKLAGYAGQATEAKAGRIEIATQAETDTGSDDARAVTPKKLAGYAGQATEAKAGLIEIATQAETDTGSDDARAVTPKKLAGYAGSAATTEQRGVVELATDAEALAGSDDERAVTPAGLAYARPWLRTPINETPADGATGVNITAALIADGYYATYAAAQVARHFQVTTAADTAFAAPLIDAAEPAPATSHTPASPLATQTAYLWRCRDEDVLGRFSAWSAPGQFVTGNIYVEAPSVVAPANGATGVQDGPVISLSAFAVFGATDTHTGTSVRIRDAGQAIVWEQVDGTPLDDIPVPTGLLADGQTSYTIEARHHGAAYGASAWSAASGFTTADMFLHVATPSNVSPPNGGTGISITPALTASAYDGGGGHVASQWQVATDGGFTAIVHDSGNVAATTSHTTPALAVFSSHYWRVRYQDGDVGWSAWSAPTSFVTAQVPATPSITDPADGADDVALAPTLKSSNFSGDGAHVASQWQVATDTGFTAIVHDSGESGDLTSHNVGTALAMLLTQYHLRVRHKSDRGLWSAYSPTSSFVTRAPYPSALIDSRIYSAAHISGMVVADGNLISSDRDTGYVCVRAGVSSTVLSQFFASSGNIQGLTYDGSNLISCDDNTIYIHSGISAAVSSSFPFSEGLAGLAWDGSHLISLGRGDGSYSAEISVHDGVSATVLESFVGPKDICNGLTFDGSNLISSGYDVASGSNHIISVHDGVSAAILESFSGNVAEALAFDGANLISSHPGGADYILVHSGVSAAVTSTLVPSREDVTGLAVHNGDTIFCDAFSSAIYMLDGLSYNHLSCFFAPADNPSGLAVAGANLISCDAATGQIYVHAGIAAAVSIQFAAPGGAPAGLTYDGSNLISCDDDTIYIHSGISAAVSSSFPFSEGLLTGLAWDGSHLMAASGGSIYVLDGLTPSVKAQLNTSNVTGLAWDGTQMLSCHNTYIDRHKND